MISVLGYLLYPREVMTLKVEFRVTGDRLRKGILLTEISGDLRPEAQTCRTENNRTLEVPSGLQSCCYWAQQISDLLN